MTRMIIVYTTCKNSKEAKKIGNQLLKKHLAACYNVLSQMESASLWPPHSEKIETNTEAVLLIKTLSNRFEDVEIEILKLHSYKMPCIFALPVLALNKKYFEWLEGEVT